MEARGTIWNLIFLVQLPGSFGELGIESLCDDNEPFLSLPIAEETRLLRVIQSCEMVPERGPERWAAGWEVNWITHSSSHC